MSVTVRPATLSDLDPLAELLLAGALDRSARHPDLWQMPDAPGTAIRMALRQAMEADNPPFRQQYLLAEADGRAVGAAHSILLPVPPIYHSDNGMPGLVMEDCHIDDTAPAGTRDILLRAVEADLIAAGAGNLLASDVTGGDWADSYARHGYAPVTLYLSRTGLRSTPGATRPARAADVPAIVEASAAHRRMLHRLAPQFWKIHPEADARFGAWMTRSLTLEDRDMAVTEAEGMLTGYVVSQPATRLHFPAPHDIAGIGVVDDFYHEDFADPDDPVTGGGTDALLRSAEAARAGRGDSSVMVVCPAAWTAKRTLLERAGYATAITWYFKPR